MRVLKLREYLRDGLAMCKVKKASRMGLFVLQLVTSFRGLEMGLETRSLRIAAAIVVVGRRR